MSPPYKYRKVILTESVSPLGHSTFNVRHQKTYRRGHDRDINEETILSPTESEILDALKQEEDSVKELPAIKTSRESKKSKFPQVVQSLALVKKWKPVDKLSPKSSSFQIERFEPEGEEETLKLSRDQSKGKSFPGQKDQLRPGYLGQKDQSCPDTLANLVRLALRNGLLGQQFSSLADENAEELLKWQDKFTEAQSKGLPPPLIDLGKLPQLRPQKAPQKKISGRSSLRQLLESQSLLPPTLKGIPETEKKSVDFQNEPSYLNKSKKKTDITEDYSRLLRPKKPGDLNKVTFKGWDFGTKLGTHKVNQLPELPERATQLLRRKPPKIPVDKMVEPIGAQSLTPDEYLSLFAIYELFEFLIYSLALEKPDRPIDHVIEMTRAIKRLGEIQLETRHRMNEADEIIDQLTENRAAA